VRLSVSGALDQLPPRVTAALDEAVAALADNTGLVLNLALAYGGRQEIMHAALILAQRLQAGEITPGDVNEIEFAKGLYTPDLPDPDLVVRTSGEARLSNFLLWQSAYSEILITPVLWPDFGKRELLLAVADFQNRERRFGALPGDRTEPVSDEPASLLDPQRWKKLLKVRP
jgi:undecaprenyl diphosphate synthase